MASNFITANDLIAKIAQEHGSTEDSFDTHYYHTLEKISGFVEDYRCEKQLSQNELAKKMGVSQSMVAKYESGEYNFSLKVLMKMLYQIGYKILFRFAPIVEKNEDVDFVNTGKAMDVTTSSISQTLSPLQGASLFSFPLLQDEQKEKAA